MGKIFTKVKLLLKEKVRKDKARYCFQMSTTEILPALELLGLSDGVDMLFISSLCGAYREPSRNFSGAKRYSLLKAQKMNREI